MAEKHRIFTQEAHRFVSGSITETRDKDKDGRLIPEDNRRYEYGVAMRKDSPDTLRIINDMHTFMGGQWAADAAKIAALNAYWQNGLNGLSMKISDGDKPNQKGAVNDNTKGCYVFWFSNWGGEPPRTVDPHNQDIPGSVIKRGYFVQIAMTIKDNEQPLPSSGIYLDSEIIRFADVGDVISGGISADEAFGGTLAPTANKYQPGQVGMMPGAGATTATATVAPTAAPALPGTGNVASAPAHTPQAAAVTPVIPGTGQVAAAPVTASPISAPGVTPHNGILAGPGVAAPTTTVPGLPGA